MKRLLFALVLTFVSIFFILANASASPIPSSAVQVTPESIGFTFKSLKTHWAKAVVAHPEADLLMTYRSPKALHGVASTMTIRYDRIPKASKAIGNLQKYVDGWIKEYPRLGYEVTDTQTLTGKEAAVQLDLSSIFRKVRQTIFLKDDLAIILTCSTHPEAFEQESKACDQIVKAFHWL